MSTRAGFHAGMVHGDRVKVDGKYISNQQVFKKSDFIAASPVVKGVEGTAAGVVTIGRNAGGIEGYSFYKIQSPVSVGLNTVIPSSVPSNTKADVRLYWTVSGTAASASGVGVVWDVDYRRFTILTSGTFSTTFPYTISGAFSNATTTDSYNCGPGNTLLSGVLQVTTVSIPKADIRPNDILQMGIYRDVSSTSDNLDNTAILLWVVVDYVPSM